MRSTIITVAVLLLLGFALGCGSGGGGLILDKIEGPAAVIEKESAEFTVSARGDTRIAYLWAVNPPDAGSFSAYDKVKVTFTASGVSKDLDAVISVVVVSDHFGPVVRMTDIVVKDRGPQEQLSVSEIDGPATLNENEAALYTVSASGADSFTYEWSCEPAEAGAFQYPALPATTFTPVKIVDDTNVVISVIVRPSNADPVERTKPVTVLDSIPEGWARTWGGETSTYDSAEKVCVDNTGSVLVVGNFQGSCDFDPSPDKEWNIFTAVPGMYIAKYNSEGDFEGASLLATGPDPYIGGLAVDDSGSAYVAGGFDNWIEYHQDGVPIQYDSHGDTDSFLLKTDSLGRILWLKTWGGADLAYSSAVAIDESGKPYAAGYFNSDVDFDPGPALLNRHAVGGIDAYLVKYTPSGELEWAQTWGGIADEEVYDMAIDSESNIYVAGSFESAQCDFDPGPAVRILSPFGSRDAYVARFSPDGILRSAWAWGGEGEDMAQTLDVGADGEVYAAGSFHDTADFDPGPGSELRFAAYYFGDSYLARYSPEGELVWVSTWGSGSDVNAIQLDSEGFVVMNCSFEQPVDVDPGPGIEYFPMYSPVLIKMDRNGNYQWARTWGGYSAYNYDISVDDRCAIYAAGLFVGQADLNPGPAEQIFQSPGDGYTCYLSKTPKDGNW